MTKSIKKVNNKTYYNNTKKYEPNNAQNKTYINKHLNPWIVLNPESVLGQCSSKS